MSEAAVSTRVSLVVALAKETLQKLPHRRQFARGSEEEKQLAAEVAELFADRERAGELLGTLFPESVPADLGFYDRLNDFHQRLGWDDLSHRAAGLLWSTALQCLTPDAGEALLRTFLDVDDHHFFIGLHSLQVLLKENELRTEFAVGWFEQIVRRIGNSVSGGFGPALSGYCEAHILRALELLRVILLLPPDDSRLALAAFVLGAVRTFPKDTTASDEFRQLDVGFATHAEASKRVAHHRSWVQTAWRGKMTVDDLDQLIQRMEAGTPEEFQEAFRVVCSSLPSPSLDAECMHLGLAWLHAKASPAISATAKFHVVDFVTVLAEQGRRNTNERSADCRRLLLAVQPVPEEDKGTWKRMESFLVRELQTDRDEFSALCLELAERSAESWLRVLRKPRSFDWLLSEMAKKDVGKMVGKTILSPDADPRELGLFLFDRLALTSLPEELLEDVSEEQLRVILHELQRVPIQGAAIARGLIAFLTCVERASQALQEDFHDELVLQAKNYPGECREEFQRKAQSQLLRKALDDVAPYFEKLRQVLRSSINSMEVPGYSRAAYLYRRRFSNEIDRGAREASLFLSFIKSVRVLYGKSWSSYGDGNLTATSPLKPLSHTIEVPRLEMIDPEFMALRRLHASARTSKGVEGRE